MLRAFLLVLLCLVQLSLALQMQSHQPWNNNTICYAVSMGMRPYYSTEEGQGYHNPGLDKPGQGWTAAFNDVRQSVIVGSPTKVKWVGVITQGRQSAPRWVSSYHIRYTADGLSWQAADNFRVFEGNTDQNTRVAQWFKQPFNARAIKLIPAKWHEGISMRFEFMFEC